MATRLNSGQLEFVANASSYATYLTNPGLTLTSGATSQVSQSASQPSQQPEGLDELVCSRPDFASAPVLAEKPKRFECPQCPSKFQTKWNAAKHVKVVHLKEKLHRCDICQHTFGARNNLKRHREDVHLKIRKHHCTVCAQSFGQRATLKRHLSLKHKFEVEGNSYRSKGKVEVERTSLLSDEGTASMLSKGLSSVLDESLVHANESNTQNTSDISPAFQEESSSIRFEATHGMSISDSGASRIGYQGHALVPGQLYAAAQIPGKSQAAMMVEEDYVGNSVIRADLVAAVELFLLNPYSWQ